MKNGWVTKKLGEVCEIKLGKTPPRDDYSLWDRQKSSGYVWVSISDMTNLTDGQIIDSKEYITNKAIEEAGVPIVKKGTLLLSFKLTIGRTAIAGRDLSTNEAIAALPLKQEFAQLIDLHYLVFYFAAFDWYLFAAKDDKMLGKTLNKKRLATVPVLIPPLAEQKRIVAKIDAAFEKIDKLKANAERNLANAKDLFQSALDEAMRPKDGWVEKRLGEVAEIQRGGSPRPIKDFITKNKDGYNWIKIGDVDPSGKFITSTAEKIRKEGLRKTRQVFAGEFLLSNSMSFGRPYILKIDGCIHDGWLVLRGFQKFYKEDFFYHLLRSKWIQNQFNSLAYGSTVRNLNSNSVSNVIVPIVALEEQQEIADSLDRLQSQAGVLQQNYSKQIADCMEMRQAVLREAFEGRL